MRDGSLRSGRGVWRRRIHLLSGWREGERARPLENLMSQRLNLWGYTFDPETGLVYDDQDREQPYTFQSASITGPDGQVYEANPLQFPTRDTAEKILAHLQALRPDLELKLVGYALAGGMYVCPVVEYGIQTPSGTVMSAGLVANTLMRSKQWADASLKAELERYGTRRQ